ncbi:MAG: exonuclease SbcCD subunit D [Chloroherpetonaceae bacterium]|nr:exonuclease SbcCD subunit D [Chloroherpetonaceae bacterium]
MKSLSSKSGKRMKVLHTADIHIGYDTHGRLDAKTGLNSRWLDVKRSFEFMVEKAIEEDIDLFLFCGDAYRDAMPTPTEQRIFTAAVRPLLERQIPVVCIVGNHDHPVSFGRANALQVFPDLNGLIYLFDKPRAQDFETKSGKVRIVGLPWASKSALAGLKQHAHKTDEELRAEMHEIYTEFIEAQAEEAKELPYPVILAGHLHVDVAALSEGSERIQFGRDPMFGVASLAKRAFSYVALGHIHKHQDLNPGAVERGEPPVVYSGSIERISFSEANDPKGFVIVEFDDQKRAHYRFVETPARRFLDIAIDVRAEETPMQKVKKELEKYCASESIVRVRIACKPAQQREIDFKAIKDQLSSAFNILPIQLIVDEERATAQPVINKAMSMREALVRYIDVKRHDLVQKKEKLLAKFDELAAS